MTVSEKYTQIGEYQAEYSEFQYHGLLDSMISSLNDESYECYYVCNHGWDIATDNHNEFRLINELKNINYTRDIVIWLVHDSLRGVSEHNWYDSDFKLQGLHTIQEVCRANPTKQFLLLTPHCYLQSLVEVNNLHAIDIPPYPWMAAKSAHWYSRVYEHRADLKYNWVTFMHSPGWHRTMLLAYLLFLGLDKSGAMSVSNRLLDRACEFKSAAEYLTYEMSPIQWHCIEQGFSRLKTKYFENVISLPPSLGENVINNYNNTLQSVYKQTGVELVTGSTYSEPIPYITEKEVQSIYGCNFLIFINPTKTVTWFRDQGFDMFDDIVDHSYDDIADPAQRIFTAINNNIHLLNGTANIKSLLAGNQQRFYNNCELADSLSSKLSYDSIQQFNTVIEKINEQ
jgi:hypothetical protein